VAISIFSGYLAHATVHRLLPGLPERGPKPFAVWPLVADGRPAVGLTASTAKTGPLLAFPFRGGKSTGIN
jgi:hypothetical protein